MRSCFYTTDDSKLSIFFSKYLLNETHYMQTLHVFYIKWLSEVSRFYKHFSILHGACSIKSLVHLFLATKRLKTVSIIEKLLYTNINTMNRSKF